MLGRRALLVRSKMAPDPAVLGPLEFVAKVSYSLQLLWLIVSMWASLPDSIFRSLPYGYRPPSLSLAYWKVKLAVAWLESTTLKGMP